MKAAYNSWRGENAETRYPFSDLSSLLSAEGYEIPRGVFVDAVFHGLSPAVPRLSSIAVSGQEATVTVTASEVLTGVYDLSGGSSQITLSDAFGRVGGAMYVDSALFVLEAAKLQGRAATFGEGAAEFVVDASSFAPGIGVAAVQAQDTRHSGKVWLVAGPGVYLSQDGQGIRIDLVGDPDWRRLSCQRSGVPVDRVHYLRSMNGMVPDAFGNFLWLVSEALADPVLRLGAGSSGGLSISVVCAKGLGDA